MSGVADHTRGYSKPCSLVLLMRAPQQVRGGEGYACVTRVDAHIYAKRCRLASCVDDMV